jgi:hypothetical protein
MSLNPKSIALLTGLLMFVVSGCAHKNGASASASAAASKPASNQLTFASPDDAVKAVLSAFAAHDKDQLQRIFGPDGDDLLDSGDAVADQQTAKRFTDAYNEKHRFEYSDDGKKATLCIGNDDWPMPIPIVKDSASGAWSFDTDAGKDEIVNRRIGRNELDVIQVCKAICDAQQEYVQLDPDGNGIPEYAAKIVSDPGKKNGLYWPTQPGEKASPLGDLAAKATAEGYGGQPRQEGELRPYHGYFYKLITAQGPNAQGGAMDYMVNGQLIGGFAVVAWPADYGNSGIMTFITNYQGEVYQKDLGEQTDATAKAMKAFDPDPSWKKAE